MFSVELKKVKMYSSIHYNIMKLYNSDYINSDLDIFIMNYLSNNNIKKSKFSKKYHRYIQNENADENNFPFEFESKNRKDI